MLFTTALLDELTTGLLVVALPLLRDTLHLSYAQAGLIFTVDALSSVLIEPPITLAADRRPLHVPILAGMLALTTGFALAGFAPNYLLLLVAVVLIFPANGTAVGLAQSALIDAATPRHTARTMTRWTLLSGVGDLLAPIAVGVGVALGMGRAGCALWRAASGWRPRSCSHQRASPRHTRLAKHLDSRTMQPQTMRSVRRTTARFSAMLHSFRQFHRSTQAASGEHPDLRHRVM